ncbi:hypothetical protein E1A91_A06G199100v1 [Gossypium mustelinum]|uniref:Uncharacterized protein n=4 Tax=Gossypium TaxID=3633 RepID=A0A5J5VHR0_GOSBA|nr:hypothetical protein ES319_A06G198000v1 [Gossypium barbadense]TYH14474.1 hypothetical protein ES288_A06G222700v1 [Gossypium darwinii]TYI24216.1 hypothetical protein ES332_A06G217900v1 [Gossypium tomentosum]TYJ31450.1 hypothetical protein E1A91_A06G199100v1 [Gossypium mustelinum]
MKSLFARVSVRFNSPIQSSFHPHNRRSPSPSKPRLEAYSHPKIPILNSNFDEGDKDPDGAPPKVPLEMVVRKERS